MFRFTLQTQGEFAAAHALWPYSGLCRHWHGHTWRLVLALTFETPLLDQAGILVDYHELDGVLEQILKELDHHCLVPRDHPDATYLRSQDPEGCVLLPRVSSEALALYIWDLYKSALLRLEKIPGTLQEICITIQESPRHQVTLHQKVVPQKHDPPITKTEGEERRTL